jgi:hypothetical protein
MASTSGSDLPDQHRAEADDLTRRLHEGGWSSQVSVDGLLRRWEQLAGEAGAYELTIDDYTNDLTTRDALALVLGWASEALRELIFSRVEAADERFRAGTVEDAGEAVGKYYRVVSRSGWWWRRRPTTGTLAAYLDRA